MSNSMNRLRALVSTLHSYQYASLDRSRIGRDDIDESVKIGTLKLLILPIAGLAAVPFVFTSKIGMDASKTILVVAIIASVFGLSWFTDRIYDMHRADIKALANQILENTEKGRNWARRKIAAIIVIQLVALFVLAGLGRLYVVYGTSEPFLSV